MHFSPEHLAEARALIARIVKKTARQAADCQDMEQEVVGHLIQLEDQYERHPPGYWARTIKNKVTSIKRAERAQKRGASKTSSIGEDGEPADRRPAPPCDRHMVAESLDGASYQAAAFAQLLTKGSKAEAMKALGLSRRQADALLEELADKLRGFAPVDPKEARRSARRPRQ